MTTRTGRAAPLPPDERRAAIVAAAMPLVRKHGYAVTTRQLAEAADVAEGTIFRVFADKAALVDAVIEAAFDPTTGIAAFDRVDRSLPLEVRVERVAEMLAEGMRAIWELMGNVASTRPGDPMRGSREKAMRDGRRLMESVGRVFAADAHRLTISPDQFASLVNGMVIASMHARRIRGEEDGPPTLSTGEIAHVLVHGVLRTAPDPDTGADTRDRAAADTAGDLAAALLEPERTQETAAC